MLVIIENDYLKKLYEGSRVKGKPEYNEEIIRGFKKCILKLKNVKDSKDLGNLKSLHFEKLSGNLKGKYSVRINDSYRVIFRLEKDGKNERIEIILIEDLSNHYS
jgi:toxin HigB-1